MIQLKPRQRVYSATSDLCQTCGDKHHGGELPHNRDSALYQAWFQLKYGRLPTWADAAADCSEETRRTFKTFLERKLVPSEKIGDL